MATKEQREERRTVTDVLSMLVQTDGVEVKQIVATTGHSASAVKRALADLAEKGKAVSERAEGVTAPAMWYAAADPPPAPKASRAKGAGTGKSGADRKASGKPRLGKGDLTAAVVEYLKANRGVEVSPVQVSKALDGRSVGAISNALEKMASDAGSGVKLTQEKPRRYCLA